MIRACFRSRGKDSERGGFQVQSASQIIRCDMMDAFVSQEELIRQVCTVTTSTQGQNYPQDMLIQVTAVHWDEFLGTCV